MIAAPLLVNPTPEDLRCMARWAEVNAVVRAACTIPASAFTLTGSDHPRDVGAAAGQLELSGATP